MSTTKNITARDFFIGLAGLIIIFIFLWLLFFIANPLGAFLIVFAILFISFIFVEPFYGLLILIILRPTLDIFTNQSVISIGQYSLNIASVLAILVIGFSFAVAFYHFRKLSSLPLKIPLLVFICLTFTSIFFSQSAYLSLAEWLRILSIFSLYLLGFILIKNKADFKKLIFVVIGSAFIPAIVAFYQFFTGTGITIISENISNRIFGTFAHPNLLAYYIALILILLVFLILNRQKYQLKNSLLYSFFALNGVLLLLTYTRGAWLFFLVALATVGIVKYKKFLLGALLALFIFYLVIPPLNTRVNSLFKYDPFDSIQWRIELWKDGIKYSKEHIIAGHGLGTASKIILDRRGESFGSPDPHNDYLKILLENGIIGIVSYLFLIISLFITLIKGYFQSKEFFTKNLFLLFIGISLGLYLMSFADNILRNTALQWSFWIILGALFAIYQKPNSKLT